MSKKGDSFQHTNFQIGISARIRERSNTRKKGENEIIFCEVINRGNRSKKKDNLMLNEGKEGKDFLFLLFFQFLRNCKWIRFLYRLELIIIETQFNSARPDASMTIKKTQKYGVGGGRFAVLDCEPPDSGFCN